MRKKRLRRLGILVVTVLAAMASVCPAAADKTSREDWPCWRGPRTDGTAGEIPPASALVHKPEDARLVWKSEAEWTRPYGFTSGYASPCVADGRVFLFWYVGDGKSILKTRREGHFINKKNGSLPDAFKDRLASIAADEIVLCVDARNGKTLWRWVMPSRGINLMCTNGKNGGHFSMAAADGKAFAIGTNARLYALDAATGETLWSAPTGGTEQREQWLEACIAANSAKVPANGKNPLSGCPRQDRGLVCSCAAYADGVVLFRDKAFDADTGKVRWTCKRYGGYASPVVWNHEGRSYFISGGGLCVEPETGKVLWEAEGGFDRKDHRATVVVGDGYLVLGAANACYRITPEKAELVWKIDKGGGCDMGSSSVIHNGHLWANTSHPGGHRREGKKYGGAANHVCIELATGKEVARIGAPSNSGSLVAFGPWIIQESIGAGPLHKDLAKGLGVYRADPKAPFALVCAIRYPGPRQDSVTPAIVGSRIYIRGGERLYCYDLAKADG